MLIRRILSGLHRLRAPQPNYTSCRHSSLFERFKEFISEMGKGTFHPDRLRHFFKYDNFKEVEHALIYRDLNASRSFILIATSMSICFFGCTACLVDISVNEPRQRSGIVKKLSKDVKELGVLAPIPIVLVVLTVFVLLRMHSLRILRVYQQRTNPDAFTAIVSRGVIGQKKVSFLRGEAESFYSSEMTETDLAMIFILGNVQIGRRRFFLDDDCFLGNNYRNYMLNETKNPPPL